MVDSQTVRALLVDASSIWTHTQRARLRTLCEKATELGVTVLQPVITEVCGWV